MHLLRSLWEQKSTLFLNCSRILAKIDTNIYGIRQAPLISVKRSIPYPITRTTSTLFRPTPTSLIKPHFVTPYRVCHQLTLYEMWDKNSDVESHLNTPTHFVTGSKNALQVNAFYPHQQNALRIKHFINPRRQNVLRLNAFCYLFTIYVATTTNFVDLASFIYSVY